MNKKSRIKLIKNINKQAFYKQAFYKQADFADFLSSHFSSIIDKEHPYESIINIVSTGVVTGLFGPAWGIIAAILDTAGINVTSIWDSLKNILSSFFATNPTITTSNVDSIATNLANQTIQHNNVSQEALQLELQPKEANQYFNLEKNAGILDDLKNNPIVGSLVKGLAKKSVGGLLSGVLFTVIKALLVGGGFAVGASYLASKIKGQPSKSPDQAVDQATKSPQEEQNKPKETSLLQYIQSIISSSGKGEVIHKNDADVNNNGQYAWYIPSKGNISKTIYDWIFEIYPTIPNNVEDVIYNNYSKVITPLLNTIQKWNSENINSLQEVRIPNNFLSRKQIVDYILSSFILQ